MDFNPLASQNSKSFHSFIFKLFLMIVHILKMYIFHGHFLILRVLNFDMFTSKCFDDVWFVYSVTLHFL